jgi:hypothetical protein
MIEIEVNNCRKLELHQDKVTNSLKVLIGNGNKIDTNYNISEGDFIMLLIYYRYIKDNDIHCDFINSSGKIEIK